MAVLESVTGKELNLFRVKLVSIMTKDLIIY